MQARRFRRGAPGQAIVEFAMTTLVFLGLVFAIGDFGLWIHAQNAATGAAQVAAATAAREDGTPEAGQQAGQNFLRAALGTSAGRVALSVKVSADVASATASGTWTISPLGDRMSVPILATATVTRERFRPQGT
ncbi:MAG TPA: TadE/TadG family type IV pilus assembly protein [Chloroflexota bacterium]